MPFDNTSFYERVQCEIGLTYALHNRYDVGVGTIPGGTQLQDFQEVSSPDHYAVINNLDLTSVRQAFVTVKAYNEAGLYSTATSNGVYISRLSAGLEPLGLSYVYDGSEGDDLYV